MTETRKECPPENIGKVFGTIGIIGKLEGSILSPDYCIVYGDFCERHEPTEKLGKALAGIE